MNFFKKITSGLQKSSESLTKGISQIFSTKKIDAQTLEELEELLITSDIGVATAAQIIEDFRKKKIDKEADEKEIKTNLAAAIEEILIPCEKEFTPSKKPHIVLMVGVNGSGKTTTIGKLAAKFKAQKKQISMIAGDTFRAAAVEQLIEWGKKSEIKTFSGKPNADSAGVIYDGINEAINRKDDIIFIDTAGRLQNKKDLMEELKKIIKVIKKLDPEAPHHTVLTLDASTGLNLLDQVETFKEMVDINGLIITKLDGTGKAGVVIPIANKYKLPIFFIGLGEGVGDLKPFSAKNFSQNLLGL